MEKQLTNVRREMDRVLRECRVKKCLHPNKQECSSKIIKAHSIQNNKILNKLSSEGEVIVATKTSSATGDFGSIGRKIATTFSGFCSKHDNQLFSPIENKNYIPGDLKQEFLFAYRSLSREMIVKEEAKNLYLYLIKEKSVPLSKLLQGTEIGLKDLDSLKEILDSSILSENFDDIETKTIIWNKEFPFAVSSIFNLEYDFKNNLINDLGDLSRRPKPIYLTIFPQDGKTYTLFSYMKKDAETFPFLKEQFLNISQKEQKRRISLMVCLYCENFAISPEKWRGFDKNKRKAITEQFWSSTNLDADNFLNLKQKTSFNLFS